MTATLVVSAVSCCLSGDWGIESSDELRGPLLGDMDGDEGEVGDAVPLAAFTLKRPLDVVVVVVAVPVFAFATERFQMVTGGEDWRARFWILTSPGLTKTM